YLLEHHEAGRSRRQTETRGKAAIARSADPCLAARMGAHQSHGRISLAEILSVGFRPLPQTTPSIMTASCRSRGSHLTRICRRCAFMARIVNNVAQIAM